MRLLFLILTTVVSSIVVGQQIGIPRIDSYPDITGKYVHRDWKKTTRDYDQMVFDIHATGEFLPFVKIVNEGYNYPSVPTIYMDTFVGSAGSGNQGEAINIMPAIVGALLNDITKNNQFGVNWIQSIKNFYNLKNKEFVYLNNYNAKSGHDWWYDLMPNIYFYQLYDLYQDNDADFESQFVSVANQWRKAVNSLGGSTTPWQIPDMNYRAFDLISQQPLQGGVTEPESAGTIAWLLYHAYQKTGNKDYLHGAELSLDFLNQVSGNPSYELQLPYGALVAAKMNALEGTAYDMEKLVNWCFNRGDLRGWGSISGQWGDYNASGLIGEANDKGNDYAFIMNGFQHAAALVPMVKYDKRFARAIAKWMLHLSAASHLMYPDGLPQEHQHPQSYQWSTAYDLNHAIPYESMKETWEGKSPYARGDAFDAGWAKTNLSLYSGSSVGYLASILNPSNVEGILELDVNKTDFFGGKKFNTYLYYNPFEEEKTLAVALPSGGSFDIYDAVSEQMVGENISALAHIPIPAKSTRLVTLYPHGLIQQQEGKTLLVDGYVIDYHYGYDYSSLPRIKSLSASKDSVSFGGMLTLYTSLDLIENGDEVDIKWYVNKNQIEGEGEAEITWTAPDTEGVYEFTVQVTSGEVILQDSVEINVLEQVFEIPSIQDISMDKEMPLAVSDQLHLSAIIDVSGEYSMHWIVGNGSIQAHPDHKATWLLPQEEGVYELTLEVVNEAGMSSKSMEVLVKQNNIATPPAPLIYIPFNEDITNVMNDYFDLHSQDVAFSSDPREYANHALRLRGGESYALVTNQEELNFENEVAVSFWVKPLKLNAQAEQFIVSHGSWEQRYKVSVTENNLLRWTLNTTDGIADVDANTTLQYGQFTHVTCMYTGYSLELYLNGELEAFKKHSGTINISTNDLILGQKNASELQYNFTGIVDEFRLYNQDLPYTYVRQLPDEWEYVPEVDEGEDGERLIWVYPNPAKNNQCTVAVNHPKLITHVDLFNLAGQKIKHTPVYTPSLEVPLKGLPQGYYIVKVVLDNGSHLSTSLWVH